MLLSLLWSNARGEGIKETNRRADWLLQNKRYEEAVLLWRQALQKAPNDVNLLVRLGVALSLLERYPQAQAILNRALEVEPNNPKVLYNIGLVYLRQNEDEKALRYLHQTLEKVDWYPEANYHIGLIYERRGLKDKAMESYIQEVNHNPVSAKAWQRIFALKQQLNSGATGHPPRKKIPLKTAILGFILLVILSGTLYLKRKERQEVPLTPKGEWKKR